MVACTHLLAFEKWRNMSAKIAADAALTLVYILLLREFGLRLALRPPFLSLARPMRFAERMVESLARGRPKETKDVTWQRALDEREPASSPARRRVQMKIIGAILSIAVVNLFLADM